MARWTQIGIGSGRRAFYLVSAGIGIFFCIAILIFIFEPAFIPQTFYDLFGTAVFGSGFLYLTAYALLPIMVVIVVIAGAVKLGASFLSTNKQNDDL